MHYPMLVICFIDHGHQPENYNWDRQTPSVASMHALTCPNVAGGSGGGALSPPFPQWGCYGAEPPRKNLKALNCV